MWGWGLLGFLLSHSTCHPKLYTTNCKVHKQIKPIFLITLLHLVTGEAVTHKIKYREPRNSRTKTNKAQTGHTHTQVQERGYTNTCTHTSHSHTRFHELLPTFHEGVFHVCSKSCLFLPQCVTGSRPLSSRAAQTVGHFS